MDSATSAASRGAADVASDGSDADTDSDRDSGTGTGTDAESDTDADVEAAMEAAVDDAEAEEAESDDVEVDEAGVDEAGVDEVEVDIKADAEVEEAVDESLDADSSEVDPAPLEDVQPVIGTDIGADDEADPAVAEPQRTQRVSTTSPAASTVDPPAEAADSSTAAAPVNAFFNNVTPTLSHDPSEDIPVGDTILGSLHPVDPDSSTLRYTATKPANGTVDIDSDGSFVYTPGPTYAGQDSFIVTVSDARSGFHIHGVQGLISLFTFGLLGNRGHKTTETVFIGSQRTVVAAGLHQPVDFRFLPDGRVLLAEKTGAIKIVDNGTVLDQPLITLSVNNAFERGISGMTLDPQFSDNGYLYVAYTTAEIHDRLSRLTVVGDTAAPDSEMVLYETPDTVALYHRGGGLAFGPDGKLYWGKGDDLYAPNGQDLTNVYGKILRINPDGTVPSDNPDFGPGAHPLIWAYGLRNPFRMSFTADGDLLVADVGQSLFEELNLVTAGGNYGWPDSEGLCTSDCAGQTDPIYTYPRGAGAAITAGLLYTGGQLGVGYQDKVFIADEVQGWIKVLTCDAALTMCGDPQTFDPDAGPTVVLAQGPDGNLYQLVYDTGDQGRLVRIALAGPVPA
ncbi:PQQ-dependent sugar dehydrogenase [Mycolicibacterium palauense]|uniref:PQQ-dependent sugar dehydrogenase n=1 Tax=Mycolicibacterium palauense TaxID=2034511 RepID=UPI00159BAAE6|nr:PQQ-dependent sugar dehydrogenase [Mycolicibacterium palauense]